MERKHGWTVRGHRRGWQRTGALLCATAVALLTAATVAAAPASAATLRVPQQFPTIQSAEDNASPGDLIAISRRGREYREQVAVDVPDLIIRGTEAGVVVNGFQQNVAEAVFDVEADNVLIQRLTLRNGRTDGVDCDAANCEVRDVRVDGDTDQSCVDITGDDAVVDDLTAVGCSGVSILVDGDDASIEGNSVRLSGEACVEVTGDDVLIQENTSIDCEDGDAFNVTGSNPVVMRNRGIGIDDDGIEVDCSDGDGGAVDCSGARVTDNDVEQGADDATGIAVNAEEGSGDGFEIRDNTVDRVTDNGFDLNLNEAFITGNRVTRSGAEDDPAFEITGDGNRVRENEARDNGFDGFVVDGDGNELLQNRVSAGESDGIQVEAGDRNVLIDNRASNNTGDGIENDGDRTVLRKNVSFDNGRDCANDGTIAKNVKNRCDDSSDFARPGTTD